MSNQPATAVKPWTIWSGLLSAYDEWTWRKLGIRSHVKAAKALARHHARAGQIRLDFGDGRVIGFGYGDWPPSRIYNRNGTEYWLKEIFP